MEFTKEELLAKPPVFVDLFSHAEEVFGSFEVDQATREHAIILYAKYTYEDWSGYASVIGYDTDTESFFQVSGSHCSCYGLEGEWEEELLTVEEINEFYRRGAEDFVEWLDA